MDNRGIPARVNSRSSQVWRYAEHRRIQDPSEGWPFDTPVMYEALQVPLSNRRGKQVVEAAEPSLRINTEAKVVADENNRETPIVISSGSEDDSDDDAGDACNASASNPANVSQGPNEGAQVEDRNGKRAASVECSPRWEPLRTQNEESSSRRKNKKAEDAVDENSRGAEIEYQRQLKVAIQESLNTAPTRREVENVVDEHNLGAEYDRQLDVAIRESLNTDALRRGNIGNESASNPVMELRNLSHCPNEDSEDERAQVEALEAEIGKLISNIEPADSMPCPPVSSRGRALKPTHKLLKLPNATIAPLPSKRKRKDGASIDRQTKQKASKPAPAVPRFNEGNTRLNRRPRGLLRRQGVIDVSEPRGPGSVVGQASLANGMDRPADVVNTNGSGAGVSEPSGSGSLGGQAREVNEVGRQTDMAAPLPELMVCVTNRNPMDLPVEEAIHYMRSENQVSSAHKVKLFGAYLS